VDTTGAAWTGATCAVRVSADGLRRVYARLNATIWLVACVQGFGLAGFGAAANTSSATVFRVGVLVVLLVDLLACWRLIRTSIVIDHTQLVARAVFTTRRLTAEQIARFERPESYGAWRGNGLRIVLASGRTVVTGVFTGTPSDPVPGRAQVVELNAWLTQARIGALQPVHVAHAPARFRRARLAWTATLLLICAALFALLIGLVINALIDPSFVS
jgi:hypothetical protein